MKKHLIILFLLISMFGYSQTFTTYQRWKRVTTAEKLAIPVTDNTVVYEVFDTDLGRYETYNSAVGSWQPSTSPETDPLFTAWDKDYNDLINKPTFKVVQNEYANITELYSDQSNQTATYIQYVLDASGFPDVISGDRYFEYLGTTNGDASDYRLLSNEESGELANIISNAPYDATAWDNNLEGASKNALRDKIETLVTLNTSQIITATKTFNTGANDNNRIVITNSGTGSGIRATNSAGGYAIWSSNTGSGYAIRADNASSGTGMYANNTGTGLGILSYNSSTGRGIYVNNVNNGVGLYSLNGGTSHGIYSLNNSSGNGIVSSGASTSTGFVFVGQNINANTFTVTKLGDITGNKFIKSGGTSSQYLMADGSVSTGGGGATQISADSVFVSPAIKGYGNAYELLEAHQTSIDSIQANMRTGINTAFRSVTSTSGVFAESYDADQPNFQLTLDEDVEIEITDAVNGDFLIAEIVNPEDEPFLVTFIGSDKEYLIEGGETAVFSMITNANDETIWIKSILEDIASTYKEMSETGAVAIDFKNYDFIKLNVEDENYLEFINPRKNVSNLTLHLENKEGVPYDIHFPENTLFKTLGQGATIELGSDKLGVFKFDYRDGGYICTSYDVDYDIPVVHTYTIVRRVNTGSTSDITATDGFIDWQMGLSGGPGGPFNNLQVTTGNNLATTSTTWTRHGSIPSSMPDADFQTLFDSERWDESSGSEMKYTFSSMTAGTYKVRIYMGESNNLATVGTRVFDIKIQGNTVDTVDMVDRFGDNEVAGMIEYDNIIVSGTTLDVEWIHVTENPVVNGIEILKRD